jgi:sugar phosphate isomerase/epimerase
MENSGLTRRTFLQQLTAASAAGLVAGSASSLFAQNSPEPHIDFPTAPRDRISIASYPFRAYIDMPGNRERDPKLPGMDFLEFPAHVVEKFNIHNIEPYGPHFRSLEPAYLGQVQAALHKADVKVVNIAASVRQSFYDPDAATRARAVAGAKKWIDAAVAIGSPGVRMHIGGARKEAPNLDRCVESFRSIVEYAESKNVVVTLENDDLLTEDAFFIVKLITTVNHLYLRALPDFANSAMKGDPDFNYRAVASMFQFAYNICHVKDGETDEKGKYIHIDMKKTFDILRSANFRGYCSMEYDAPGDPYPPTKKFIEETLKYLS